MTPDQYRREGAEAMRRAIALGFVGHVRENVRRTPLPTDTTALDRLTAPDAEAVTMTYRNWRGEVGKRTIAPIRVWFGATEWHPEPGWLLSALDMEKGAARDFALADCQFSDLTPAPGTVAERPCTDCGHTHDTDGDLCPTCVCVRAEIAAMEAEMKNREDQIVRAALGKAAWVTNEARKYMASVGAEEEELIMGDITHRILNISTEQVMMSIQEVDGVPSHHTDAVARLVEAARAGPPTATSILDMISSDEWKNMDTTQDNICVQAGRPCTDCGRTHDTDGDLCPTCVCVRAEIAAMEKDRD